MKSPEQPQLLKAHLMLVMNFKNLLFSIFVLLVFLDSGATVSRNSFHIIINKIHFQFSTLLAFSCSNFSFFPLYDSDNWMQPKLNFNSLTTMLLEVVLLLGKWEATNINTERKWSIMMTSVLVFRVFCFFTLIENFFERTVFQDTILLEFCSKKNCLKVKKNLHEYVDRYNISLHASTLSYIRILLLT